MSPSSAKKFAASPAAPAPAEPKHTTAAISKAPTPGPKRSRKKLPAAAVPVVVTPDPPRAEATDEQVGQRAYQIWIEKGRPYGQEQANWDQAVAELRG
ncbi:MAG: DUF2934 domain-containing protein [Planctomycetota bacterium]